MISKIKFWYSLEVFEEEEDRRMARIQAGMIAVYLLSSLAALFLDLSWGDKSLAFFIILGCLLQLVSLFILVKGHLNASNFLSIGLYIIFVTTFATFGQGIRDYVIMAYPAIIMFAGLVAYRQGLFISTMLTAAGITWLVLGEANGWYLPRKIGEPNWMDLVAAQIIIVVSAISVYSLISNAQHGLTQTWRELAQRKRTEEALLKSEKRFRSLFNDAPIMLWEEDFSETKLYLEKLKRNGITDFDDYFNENPGELFACMQLMKVIGVNDSVLNFFQARDLPHLVENLPMTFTEEAFGVFKNALIFLAEGRTLFESEVTQRILNGEVRYVFLRVFLPPLNAVDKYSRVIVSMVDITKNKQAEIALRESEARYSALVNASPDAVTLSDINGNILACNQRAAVLHGYESPSEMQGKNVSELLLPAEHESVREQVLQSAKTGNRVVIECTMLRKDGSRFFGELSTSLALNEMGMPDKVIGISRDITTRKQAEEENIKLRNAVEHSADVIFITDAAGVIEYVNPAFEDVTGYSKNETIGKTPSLLNSELMDKERIEHLWQIISSGKVFHGELVNRKKNGDLFHYEQTITPIMDSNKRITHFVSTGKDITERKRAYDALREIQSRLQLLSHNLEDAALYVYSHDKKGRPVFEYLSSGMEQLTGIKIEDALRDASSLHATILPEYLSALAEHEAESKKKLSSFEMEIRQRHAISGEVRWMLLRSTPRRRQDGSTVWYGVQVDISRRKLDEKLLEEANVQLRIQVEQIEKLHLELREQAIRDPLTGLYNRRYMQDAFAREFSRAEREDYPLTVIMLDMDELKKINDHYGHPVGDLAIKTLAAELQRLTRVDDIVCRYGGDEFTLTLYNTTSHNALKRVEEWRDALKSHPLKIKIKIYR